MLRLGIVLISERGNRLISHANKVLRLRWSLSCCSTRTCACAFRCAFSSASGRQGRIEIVVALHIVEDRVKASFLGRNWGWFEGIL